MTTRSLRRFLSDANSTRTAEPPESVNVESDFVVILAALLCALICVVGLIAVARCAWLRRSSSVAGGRSAAQLLANKGLKKKVLQSLPKFTYNSASKGKLVEECAICLAEFVEADEIRVLPQCGHGFHVGCVDTWLGSHSSCPSCRQILVVARCHQCGLIPEISAANAAAVTGEGGGGGGGGGEGEGDEAEAERKAREDNAAAFLP